MPTTNQLRVRWIEPATMDRAFSALGICVRRFLGRCPRLAWAGPSALIPIPPLAEQPRIVAKVEQLMALVDALETQLAASRATAANLLSALVTELTTPSAARPSANGAPPSQPGATPQVQVRKHSKG